MAKKIYYEKVGRKYVPVSEYDSDYLDSFPKGTHLVMSYPGGSSRRFNIDPAYAPMIAAGRVAEDVIAKAIVKATEARTSRRAMTDAEHAAWLNLIEVWGDEARQLTWPSAREAAETGVQAMMQEAEKLLANPTVRKAYERFIMICELTKEHDG